MAIKICAGEDVGVGNLFKTLFPTSLPNPSDSDKNAIERASLNEQHQAIHPEEEYSDPEIPTPKIKKEESAVENVTKIDLTRKKGDSLQKNFNGNATIGYFKPIQKYVWPE
mgnify:CR=1 FL=1